ncbi:tellurite resistance TerB family protein [Gloeocapsa sp. PCC 73106]|uniref:tellurite resistance TerB family protein n=1 Tax=Gloeocapsa sp. PCC 73106 TaxID=102232 RepID=UPI0002AC853A|nr:tellurite resistance TerB family protein [Gloeocapsa sp. PCC 73106]ELR98533.1 tellurite resistance protein [Gloeocapsa sp. PCC 73106]
MSFFTWLENQRKNLQNEIVKFKNKEFLDAVVAGCALVAAADGHIDASEKRKMEGFIGRSPELQVFDMDQVMKKFNTIADNFEFSEAIAKRQALNTIAVIKNNPQAAKLLITVCCSIGAADGNFDEDEKAMVREMCRELALNPSDFEL